MDLTVSNGGAADFNDDGAGIRVRESTFDTLLSLQNVHVRDNTVNISSSNDGGGIFNGGADVVMQRSLVTGNQALEGGGISNVNDGRMAINESTIDNNDAKVRGGGIFSISANLLLYNSTVSNNRAVTADPVDSTFGGGLFLEGFCNNYIIIVNSTVSGNQARTQGGGIFVDQGQCSSGTNLGTELGGAGAEPVGIFLLNDTIAFNEVTVTDGEGGGIYFNTASISMSLPGTTGLFSVGLGNTILAQNLADLGPDCFDELVSFGFNLFGDTSNCGITNVTTNPDQTNPAPGLGPLQDNGGPTQTHGLFDDSPAIDMGNNIDGCEAPDFDEIIDNGNFSSFVLDRDQRDFLRPIAILDPNDPICDVGAFEFQAFGFVVTKDDGLGGEEIPVDTQFDYTITVTNNGPGTATDVVLDDPLPLGMDFVSVNTTQGACAAIGQVIGCDLGDLAVGETATITVTVIATETGSFTNIVTVTLNNPFQQQLTETAQVTTNVGGIFVFGSGFHCGLQHGAVQSSPGLTAALGLMALAVLGIPLVLRGRASR
jgi:uncharacterized repeat protein (TIGR01451 family)